MYQSKHHPQNPTPLEPEPMIPKRTKKIIKATLPWVLLPYLAINTWFGYMGTEHYIREYPGASKATIEQKLENYFERHDKSLLLKGDFVYNISKPGRELAYLLHLKK